MSLQFCTYVHISCYEYVIINLYTKLIKMKSKPGSLFVFGTFSHLILRNNNTPVAQSGKETKNHRLAVYVALEAIVWLFHGVSYVYGRLQILYYDVYRIILFQICVGEIVELRHMLNCTLFNYCPKVIVKSCHFLCNRQWSV